MITRSKKRIIRIKFWIQLFAFSLITGEQTLVWARATTLGGAGRWTADGNALAMHFRFKRGTSGYSDGKTCVNGTDPPTPETARRHREAILAEMEKSIGTQYALGYINITRHMREAKEDGGNCRSKTCHFNVVHMTNLCGDRPETAYPNGKSCVDGKEPRKEVVGSQGRTVPAEERRAMNHIATEFYGRNCKSKKCNYEPNNFHFVCAGPFVQSTIFVIAVPVVVSLLLNDIAQ